MKDKINDIFNTVCLDKKNYTSTELEQIIHLVLELNEVKCNESALSLIETVAKERITGLTIDQINLAKSSDQKWLSMSGYAYENIVLRDTNKKLQNSNVEIITPAVLKNEINNNNIHNSAFDLANLKNWLQGQTFDLFAIKKENNKKIIFAVIQCKKSIRERVSRDREPSIDAMDKGFLSILVGLNPEGLGKSNSTKSKEMFNGNGCHYHRAGWNCAYFENLSHELGVIKKTDKLSADLISNSELFKKTSV